MNHSGLKFDLVCARRMHEETEEADENDDDDEEDASRAVRNDDCKQNETE